MWDAGLKPKNKDILYLMERTKRAALLKVLTQPCVCPAHVLAQVLAPPLPKEKWRDTLSARDDDDLATLELMPD